MSGPLLSLVPGEAPAAGTALDRRAIVDIGSNSIRLVVYEGDGRAPQALLNEKVLVGLGRGVARDGRLDEGDVERAIAALRRFTLLIADIGVDTVDAVATAAVRDAANGSLFIDRAQAETGLAIRLLSGEEEARASALGVIAAIPGARGVMGDLGGGSLELVRLADGVVHQRLSLPLGALRLAALPDRGTAALTKRLSKALAEAGWDGIGRDEPFYMVGGSWRALAILDMHLTRHPLPMVHQYTMPPEETGRLVRTVSQMSTKRLKAIPGLSPVRVPSLPDAAAMLAAVVRCVKPAVMVASAHGLREGLLYDALPPALQPVDPLLAAARAEGERQGRFAEHGDVLDAWMAPLFADDAPEARRLRHAACLLADVSWRAHPDYRAERGLDIAIHGNWVGIDGRGRALLGAALYANFGGEDVERQLAFLGPLADPAAMARARHWGLAMRLGQRLSGGTVRGLLSGGLHAADGRLRLRLAADQAALYGEAVVRRHKALAALMGLVPELLVDG